MMQQREVAARLYKRFPFVDLVFGTHELHHFPQLLSRALEGERVISVRESEGEIAEGLPVVRNGSFSTFVTIMVVIIFAPIALFPMYAAENAPALRRIFLQRCAALPNRAFAR